MAKARRFDCCASTHLAVEPDDLLLNQHKYLKPNWEFESTRLELQHHEILQLTRNHLQVNVPQICAVMSIIKGYSYVCLWLCNACTKELESEE